MKDDRDGGPCMFLEWDTKFFGFRIGRFAGHCLTAATIHQIRAWCTRHTIRCLYVLVDANDDETVRHAERHGLHFVDIRMSLSVSLRRHKREETLDPRIRSWRSGDVPILRDLAGELFAGTRFHKDRHFPTARAADLYREWVTKSCAAQDGTVLVASDAEKLLGFVTCDPIQAGQGRIGLCGVRDGARNQGVGTGLLRAALGWYAERGTESVEVITQGQNISAQHLYQRCGFLTHSVRLWYHWWFTPDSASNNE